MIVMILTSTSQHRNNVVPILIYNVEFLPSLDKRQRKINVKSTSNQCRIRVDASILTINLNSIKLNVVSMLCATWEGRGGRAASVSEQDWEDGERSRTGKMANGARPGREFRTSSASNSTPTTTGERSRAGEGNQPGYSL